MRAPIHLLLTASLLLPVTGCALFSPRVPVGKLGPDRILTDAEVAQAQKLVEESDKLWQARAAPANVEKALDTLKESLKIAPHNSQALWRAARACFSLAERAGADKDKKKQLELADQGIDYAKRATFVDTASTGGHYYLALNYGMHADAVPSQGLAMVKPMLKELKIVDDLDSSYDYGGPDRVMGQIYLHAPPWPTSVGDIDEAIDHLEDAADDHPQYPENQLALGEAYLKARKHNDARKHLQRVLDAQPKPDWAAELPGWQKRARELMAKLPKK
ncbi:MAG: tetratricopeptide repeat protein [Verrucomicrobia bacterium]|nr:tetratricopeptide repeat protein [Verrucomicrobiota bacterium]